MATRSQATSVSRAWDIFIEKIAPTLLVAAIVASVGYGFSAGRAAAFNSESLDRLESTIKSLDDSIKGQARVIAAFHIDLAKLQEWKNGDFFTGDRYDLARGSAAEAISQAEDKRLAGLIADLRRELDALERSVVAHHEEAERWKQKILELEKDHAALKSSYEAGRPWSGK